MKVGREGGRRKGRDGCNSLDRISSTTLEVIQTDGGGQTGGRSETDRLLPKRVRLGIRFAFTV